MHSIKTNDHHKKPVIICDLEAEICCALENQTSITHVLLKGIKCDHDCDRLLSPAVVHS